MKQELKDKIEHKLLVSLNLFASAISLDGYTPENHRVFTQRILSEMEELLEPEEIDHSIDVRYEEDVIEAFNKFIKKWCGKNYPHLIDTDEQDGQFMREKIESLIPEK